MRISARSRSKPRGRPARAPAPAGFNPAPRRCLAAFSRAGGSAAKAHGFTLLEMIVVLAILGLATAMVAPSMIHGIDSWRRQSQLDVLLDQIRGLPAHARARGLAIEISDASLGSDAPPLQVGDGMQLQVPETWRVQANGVCDGGRLLLSTNGLQRELTVAAPFCEPRFTDAP